MTSTLARRDSYDVTTVDADALVALFRTVNAERSTGAGVVWFLFTGNTEDAALLVAGVRGNVGCLSWEHGAELANPVNGSNTAHAPYFTWLGHDFDQEPGTEVPIETVYAAVREYVTTGRRPACVQWTNAPEL